MRLFLLALLPLLAHCTKTSDEDKIKAVIDRAITAANEKRAGGVVEDALPSFKGPRGADIRESRRILMGYFLSKGWVRVFKREVSVQVQGDQATATLDATIAIGKPVQKLEDILPTNGAAVVFTLELQKKDGDWKFTKASYRKKPL